PRRAGAAARALAPPAAAPAGAKGPPPPAPPRGARGAVSPAPPAPPARARAPPAATPAPLPQRESELEPEVEAAGPETERSPWYKRDISFGRGKKDAKTKAEKPKKEKPKKEKPPKSERVPFYKRELSLGGKKEKKGPAGKPKQASASAKRVKRITGLKIGGSQLAAARAHTNGIPEPVQGPREGL